MARHLKDFLRGTLVNQKCRKMFLRIWGYVGAIRHTLIFVQVVVSGCGFKKEISLNLSPLGIAIGKPEFVKWIGIANGL